MRIFQVSISSLLPLLVLVVRVVLGVGVQPHVQPVHAQAGGGQPHGAAGVLTQPDLHLLADLLPEGPDLWKSGRVF